MKSILALAATKSGPRLHISFPLIDVQACLDHIFEAKTASCLVNPRAAHETTLLINPGCYDFERRKLSFNLSHGSIVVPSKRMNLAVVGAGPAGLSCAATAAARGHKVTLFERDDKVGGQFNLAKVYHLSLLDSAYQILFSFSAFQEKKNSMKRFVTSRNSSNSKMSIYN